MFLCRFPIKVKREAIMLRLKPKRFKHSTITSPSNGAPQPLHLENEDSITIHVERPFNSLEEALHPVGINYGKPQLPAPNSMNHSSSLRPTVHSSISDLIAEITEYYTSGGPSPSSRHYNTIMSILLR